MNHNVDAAHVTDVGRRVGIEDDTVGTALAGGDASSSSSALRTRASSAAWWRRARRRRAFPIPPAAPFPDATTGRGSNRAPPHRFQPKASRRPGATPRSMPGTGRIPSAATHALRHMPLRQSIVHPVLPESLGREPPVVGVVMDLFEVREEQHVFVDGECRIDHHVMFDQRCNEARAGESAGRGSPCLRGPAERRAKRRNRKRK